ncbi:MAG: FAD-dependent oxidoreductase [Cyanobacteria bacterium P01_G01_bin.19]
MSQIGDPSFQQANHDFDCIIIGGGISGLIAATLLQRQGMKVIVLDKGRGIGGRLATRRIKYSAAIEGVFDYGTQYFSVKHPEFQPWVDDWLDREIIKEWCRGFGEVDDKPRYCGVNGTRGIAKYLARDLDVCTSTRVVKLTYDEQWLIETDGDRYYRGNFLIMTPPVPQSLKLLDDSGINLAPDIRTSLERVSYYGCIAVLALLEQPSKIPAPGGMAIESDSLVWLGDNYQKGISPQGYAVTLHATPGFSDDHWNNSDAEIADKLFAAASPWLGSAVIKYQVHRWRYSLADNLYDQPCLALPELSLILAGDVFVAPKIEGAVLSGIAAAESLKKVSSS